VSGITLWVPAVEPPPWPSVESWLKLEWPEGYSFRFVRSGPDGDGITGAWNRTVDEFLKTGDEWLFSCHNDITFQPGTLKRLMSWRLPLVSALVFTYRPPCTPMVYRNHLGGGRYVTQITETHEWVKAHEQLWKPGPTMIEPRPDEALVQIDFTSTSCCLIHRTVLMSLDAPWFKFDPDVRGGEDVWFFTRARAAGFVGYVDRSVVAGHGSNQAGALDFLAWLTISKFEGEEVA